MTGGNSDEEKKTVFGSFDDRRDGCRAVGVRTDGAGTGGGVERTGRDGNVL